MKRAGRLVPRLLAWQPGQQTHRQNELVAEARHVVLSWSSLCYFVRPRRRHGGEARGLAMGTSVLFSIVRARRSHEARGLVVEIVWR